MTGVNDNRFEKEHSRRIGFGNTLFTTKIQHVHKRIYIVKFRLYIDYQCCFLTVHNGLIITNVYQV